MLKEQKNTETRRRCAPKEDMMKKIIFFLLLVLVMMALKVTLLFPGKVAALVFNGTDEKIVNVQAQKVAVFKEFGQPGSINIGNGCIYIQEKTTIFIYNLKDYKLVNKFGKEGEGPGELKINPFGAPMIVFPINNKVYVSSLAKLTIFSKTGEYLNEHRLNSTDTYFPFGEKYICFSTTPKEENSQEIVAAFFLADENLEKVKVIYKSDFEVNQDSKIEFPITPFDPSIDGDKLYVIDGIQGFAIDAFNQNGEKIYQIKRDYNRLKIPSSYKDKTRQWFLKHPDWKHLYEIFKSRISFKEYYPPIHSMIVNNGKIYVMTNKIEKDQRECIVMDLQGNELKRSYLPIPEQYGLDFNVYFTIRDNLLYKLEENIDEETWELYRIKI